MSCDDDLDDDPLHSEDGSEAETSRHTTLMETSSEKPTASSIAHCKSLASARAIYAAVQREMFEECESLNQGFQQKPLSSSTANGLQSKSCGGGTTQSESIFGSVSVADPYPYSTSMQQARRAVIEGGAMSEDRFLELQAEVFRLRREATQRDEMHKMLTARLCRAEEAARRKMRDNLQQNLKPCKQKTDAIAAITQQYWAEQRIQELEENLRERQREVQRALENSRVYKCEIQGLKRRLEVTIRASRSEKPLCFRDRHFERDLHNQVSKLQEENHKLQFQIASLVQLPAADLQQLQTLEVPPLAGGPPHEVRDATDKSMVSSNLVAQSLKDDEIEECLLKQNLEGAKGPSAQFVTTQMLETWQRLETLKKRYEKSMDELQTLKTNHDNNLRKLQETYRELNEERRKTLQLETAERRLIAEVSSHQQTESLLQQARQHNLQLESENAELVSTTLITSSSHLSEMKALRLELAEERKLRKLAENSTSEAVATAEECSLKMQADLDAAIATTNSFSLQVEELEAFKTKLQQEMATNKEYQKMLEELNNKLQQGGQYPCGELPAFLLDIPLDKDAQDAMARIFSSEQTACIHFQILGETEELDQCINVSLCQVNLWESLQGTGDEANDMLQTELVVRELGTDQGPIGKASHNH